MSSKRHMIGFLLFDGFPMSCLTSVIEPLRGANELSGLDAFGWVILGERAGKVASSAGVRFDADLSLADAPLLEDLFLLSPAEVRFSDPGTPGRLRAMMRHGTRAGAISGGVFALARAGLVGTAPVSVHWSYRAAFEAAFPRLTPSGQVIETGGLLTASGASAGFELALGMVEARLGAAMANRVACWFQHPMIRREGVSQTVPLDGPTGAAEGLPPHVAQAIEIFAAHPSDPVPIAEVAARLSVSPRQLERGFKRHTGLSPLRYYRRMRLQRARQMLLFTDRQTSDIAADVGYFNTTLFADYYRSEFGLCPRDDRRRVSLLGATPPIPQSAG